MLWRVFKPEKGERVSRRFFKISIEICRKKEYNNNIENKGGI